MDFFWVLIAGGSSLCVGLTLGLCWASWSYYQDGRKAAQAEVDDLKKQLVAERQRGLECLLERNEWMDKAKEISDQSETQSKNMTRNLLKMSKLAHEAYIIGIRLERSRLQREIALLFPKAT